MVGCHEPVMHICCGVTAGSDSSGWGDGIGNEQHFEQEGDMRTQQKQRAGYH